MTLKFNEESIVIFNPGKQEFGVKTSEKTVSCALSCN